MKRFKYLIPYVAQVIGIQKKTLPRLRQNHQKIKQVATKLATKLATKSNSQNHKPSIINTYSIKKTDYIYCVFLKMATKEPKQPMII